MFQATTIVAVKRYGQVAIAGDGQVTFAQNTIMKATAHKVRKMSTGNVIAGFAGSVADAFTLFSKFEKKLQKNNENLTRAAVEMAKEWRTDKILRQLEALLIVANQEQILILSGSGEVIEPDDDIAAIGSGGGYALAAARTMMKYTDMPAADMAKAAISIAADICIYTNHNITVETLA